MDFFKSMGWVVKEKAIFPYELQQREVLDVLAVGQSSQFLFQHDAVAGVGGVAEGGLDAALDEVGRAPHRHRQAVPGQKAPCEHAGKQVSRAGIGDGDLSLIHI